MQLQQDMYEQRKLNIKDVCCVLTTGKSGFLPAARCVLQKTITTSNSCDSWIHQQEDKERG